MPPSVPEHDPYRAPDAHLVASSSHHELADRWARLAAFLIDAVIALVVTLPLMLATGYWEAAFEAGRSGGFGFMPLGTMVLWAVIGFALFAVIHGYPLHESGQTWGKKLLSIRIVDLQGNKPPLGELLFKRYLPTHAIVNVPCVGGLYALVDSLMIFRQDQRCLHDLIAGTRVVRTN